MANSCAPRRSEAGFPGVEAGILRGAFSVQLRAAGQPPFRPTRGKAAGPLSVMPGQSAVPAMSRKSVIFFWVMGSPIWTAETGEPSWSSSEEKSPREMPSLPMRPPS